jgi:hypothetical protein
MNTKGNCPRCEGRLRSWSELNDDEREVVRRLPESTEYSREEREKSHRWCTRCWYEASDEASRTA